MTSTGSIRKGVLMREWVAQLSRSLELPANDVTERYSTRRAVFDCDFPITDDVDILRLTLVVPRRHDVLLLNGFVAPRDPLPFEVMYA